MKKVLNIRVKAAPISLSRTSVQALQNLDRYDLLVFTSKNSRRFFAQELKKRHIALPRGIRIIHVGPRNDLLKFPLANKRILFPRSVLAPYDIVGRMRARGAVVRVIGLYMVHGVPLSLKQRDSLLQGKIDILYFKSPSGVTTLLEQFSKQERRIVQAMPIQCIGKTTAKAASIAGFKQIRIKNV